MTVTTAPTTTHRIRLAGPLGKKFGEEHVYYNLRSPAEAIRLLSINIPAFKKHLEVAHEYGVVFQVLQAGVDIGLEDLHLPLGEKEFIIAPVLVGSWKIFRSIGRAFRSVGRVVSNVARSVGRVVSNVMKSPVGKVIVGAALVAGAVMLGPAVGGFMGIGGGSGWIGSSVVASTIGYFGVSMALGGISQMISPQPDPYDTSGLGGSAGANRLRGGGNFRTGGPQSVTRGTDGIQSYAYAGPASGLGLGSAIPLIYGRAMAGGGLIAASVEVTDESDPLMEHIRQPGAQTMMVGSEKLTTNWQSVSGVQTKLAEAYTQLSDTLTLTNGYKTTHMRDQKTTPIYIAFELTGLYDEVSGAGTTKVDGYITYLVKAQLKQGSEFVDLGSITCTVQGLLKGSQTYRWAQQVDYNSTTTGSANLRVWVEIVDTRQTFANMKIINIWNP